MINQSHTLSRTSTFCIKVDGVPGHICEFDGARLFTYLFWRRTLHTMKQPCSSRKVTSGLSHFRCSDAANRPTFHTSVKSHNAYKMKTTPPPSTPAYVRDQL